MRGLEFQDMFSMARILSKTELNKEIENLVKKVQNGEKIDTEAVGIEFILTVLSKASTREVEKEIYSFLADVFEMQIDDIRHMKPKKLVETFKEADAAEWKDFFISAVRLIRQQS